jgi:hypothetical protein
MGATGAPTFPQELETSEAQIKAKGRAKRRANNETQRKLTTCAAE